VAAVFGLVLGGVFAFVGGAQPVAQPVATVVLCVAGSLLAGWLMLVLGEWLGPSDPHALAKTADDGARLPSALRVSGLPPVFSFSVGSLVALAAVYTLVPGKTRERHVDGEPRR
jgi:membrane protein DedA with SNARE-associated domain